MIQIKLSRQETGNFRTWCNTLYSIYPKTGDKNVKLKTFDHWFCGFACRSADGSDSLPQAEQIQ